VQARTDRRFDEGGALASAGQVNVPALKAYLDHPYFRAAGPKSLDRYDFDFEPVAHLSLEDGAATLTAFAAEAVALALRQTSHEPTRLIVTGGGRLNPVLLEAIRRRVDAEVVNADALGWRGDAIEAEAFAYLAARVLRGLPVSFPGTTGAPKPMTGGRIVDPTGRVWTPTAA
jgi:anhydro-N-acetylmuramic acid kinase